MQRADPFRFQFGQSLTAKDLEKANPLEEFMHLSAQNMEPDQYSSLLQLPLLKQALVRFSSLEKMRHSTAWSLRLEESYLNRAFVFN